MLLFGEHSHETLINIFAFLAHSVRTTCLSCAFQVADQPAKPLSEAHKPVRDRTSGYFSFEAKQTARSTAGSSAHWEDFPSPRSFRADRVRGCIASAVHVLVVRAHCAEPF